MALELRDMSGTFGVEVTGINLAKGVRSNEASLLQAALRDRLVMVIKNQSLSPKQYVEGIKVFGDPMRQHLAKLLMGEHPEIAVLDSRVANSRANDGKIMPIGSKDWHTDHTNHAKPPKMTVLYAVKLPKEGGDTGFANMQAAFAGLEKDEQSHLLSLTTVNVLEQNLSYVDDKRGSLYRHKSTRSLERTQKLVKRPYMFIPGSLLTLKECHRRKVKTF